MGPNGVSLHVDRGEFVAVVGASGSGKSTLMNILGCLDVPTRGEYVLNGAPIGLRSENELAEIRSLQIGFIFQGYNLIPSLNVWQNVALPMTYQGIRPGERFQRAMEALEQMEILEKAYNRISQLSGGQQQRVAIARAIATRSPVILADEPTGALDSRTGGQVLDILEGLNKTGATVILITHDMSVAARAKRLVRLKDGSIIEDTGREARAAEVGG
jgi:putative ABC transport system ATP-binding protein